MTDRLEQLVRINGHVSIERCFHQVFKPGPHGALPRDGKGNCYDCTFNYHENKQCTGYHPIKVTYLLQEEPK